MSELSHFLQELRQEGEQESEGAFTVPLKVAQEKLERFQLLDPTFYPIQMVAAACASRASFLEITTSITQLEFLYDGWSPTESQMRALNGYLFEAADSTRFISELSVGLQAALALPAKRVILESFTEEGAWQLEMRSGGQRMRELKLVSPVLPLTRVLVDKGFGLQTSLLKKHDELIYLDRCRNAPLSIRLDEEELLTPLQPPTDCLAWTQVSSPSFPDVHSSDPATLRVEHSGLSGYLALGEMNWGNQLQLVLNGVNFVRPGSKLGLPAVAATVRVEHLRKNLSFTDLVENQDYLDVLEFLKEQSIRLLVEVCKDPERSRPYWSQLLPLVGQVLRNLKLGEEEKAVLERWNVLASFSMGGHQEIEQTLKQAAELAEKGDTELAQRLRREVLGRLSSNIWSECRDSLEHRVLRDLDRLVEVADLLGTSYGSEARQARKIAGILLELPWERSWTHDPSFTTGWGTHRKGLILRYLGYPVQAAEAHSSLQEATDQNLAIWSYRFCAEIELSQQRYERADELLSQAFQSLHPSRDLAEELAFLKRFLASSGKSESVKFLRHAVPLPDSDPQVRWMLLDWLAREGRGALPLEEWVQARAQASFLELKMSMVKDQYREVEERLSPRFELLGWKSLEQARLEREEAVLASEVRFGINSSYTQYVRRRAVYQLHRLEASDKADRLQTRGHLQAQFQRCLDSLQV